MDLYYTVYINTPLCFIQTHTCARDQLTSPQMTRPPAPLLHMTIIRCQLFSEACLPTWLHRRTCWVPAVGLLYMAGIIPTSCVPLPLEPFMWLQEEKSLSVKKSFVAGAVRLNTLMNGLAQTPSGNSCDMGGRLCCNGITDLETVQLSHCSR